VHRAHETTIAHMGITHVLLSVLVDVCVCEFSTNSWEPIVAVRLVASTVLTAACKQQPAGLSSKEEIVNDVWVWRAVHR